MRTHLGPSIVVLALAILATETAGATTPNVVVFFVDDMGAADWGRSALNPLGSDVYETPNMQRLAERGVVFSNGYASAPVCSPTRVSLMTGQAPARHRTTDFIGAGVNELRGVAAPAVWSQNLSTAAVTLPEAFQAAGYETGFFGKWHLGQSGLPADPLANGFDANVGGVSSGNPGFAGGFFAGADGAWAGMPGLDTPGVYAPNDYLSDALSQHAADFIGTSAAAGTPFFVELSHYVVHTPIEAPAALVTKYQNKISQLQQGGTDLSGHTNATYAAMVEKMDQSLGRVLDRLEDPNDDGDLSDSVADNTIVLFTADNGGLTQFGVTSNRPYREGKGSIYEGGIREPYIVSWTGDTSIRQGAINDSVVATHDIYPTLLELTGVAGAPSRTNWTDGVSFAPALRGQQPERAPVVFHYPHQSPQDRSDNGAIVNGGQYVSAVRHGDWKLIWFYEAARYELYNLSTDHGETQNVLVDNQQVALELSDAMRDHLIDANAQTPRLLLGSTQTSLELPPMAVQTPPPTFDSFDTAIDYKTNGVGGSVWAGVENATNAATLGSAAGMLTITNSGNTNLNSGSFNAPMLYEERTGDFDARLQIESMTSANFHVLALVASVAGDDDLLWIGQQDRSGDGDFAQSRSWVDGVRTEQNLAGDFSHYRLVRDGDELRGYVSDDGLFWRQYASYDRPDLPPTIRVGVSQGSFGVATVTAEVASFTLQDFITLPGDFNNDGQVDVADYTTWRDGLGTRFTQADYQVWRLAFGDTAPASGQTATVPEPMLSFPAAAFVSSTLLCGRRRRIK